MHYQYVFTHGYARTKKQQKRRDVLTAVLCAVVILAGIAIAGYLDGQVLLAQ